VACGICRHIVLDCLVRKVLQINAFRSVLSGASSLQMASRGGCHGRDGSWKSDENGSWSE
jgi:hypothetical protein